MVDVSGVIDKIEVVLIIAAVGIVRQSVPLEKRPSVQEKLVKLQSAPVGHV
jgi:hypothetical protein